MCWLGQSMTQLSQTCKYWNLFAANPTSCMSLCKQLLASTLRQQWTGSEHWQHRDPTWRHQASNRQTNKEMCTSKLRGRRSNMNSQLYVNHKTGFSCFISNHFTSSFVSAREKKRYLRTCLMLRVSLCIKIKLTAGTVPATAVSPVN